ncbi:EF-P 5-aminopentanol modification-associated protein YfmF [Streptococcus dentasini]
MKLVDGVNLHLIKTDKFKTNHITLRFTGKRQKETTARRVLVAQMLALANETYPSYRAFKRALADLYGASVSTSVSTKGKAHIVDIDIEFLSSRFTLNKEELLDKIFDILYSILYRPLISLEQFQSKIFDIEKDNLISYLKADKEDSFYYSELNLRKLYFQDPDLQLSKYSSDELVAQENSFTAYQELQKMLKEDQIDIFVLGDSEGYAIVDKLNQFPFKERQLYTYVNYQEEKQEVTTEKIERRLDNQSVLQLGYHLPVHYGDKDYPAAQILNGMLGAYAHSRLFTEVREKAGLVYTIASDLDGYTGLLQVYAGVDKSDREKVLALINKQWHDFKLGRFSSHLLEQTKEFLQIQSQLAADDPKILIERTYNETVVLNKQVNFTKWLQAVKKVSKADIVHLARKTHLQAVYFLEGVH